MVFHLQGIHLQGLRANIYKHHQQNLKGLVQFSWDFSFLNPAVIFVALGGHWDILRVKGQR